MSIAKRVTAAVLQAQVDARPFTPSHAQYAQALQPLVDEILKLSVADIKHLFSLGIRHGTWDVYVLAEVKTALRLAADEVDPRRVSPKK